MEVWRGVENTPPWCYTSPKSPVLIGLNHLIVCVTWEITYDTPPLILLVPQSLAFSAIKDPLDTLHKAENIFRCDLLSYPNIQNYGVTGVN